MAREEGALEESSMAGKRRLMDFRTILPKKNEHFEDFLKELYKPEVTEKSYNVGDNYWCKPPQLPPIDYESCDTRKLVNEVPLRAGLTNGLKFIILSVIMSLQQGNTCIYIDETDSVFPKQFGPFLENYVERIGLPATSETIKRARRTNRKKFMKWESVWIKMENRRTQNTIHDIEALNYYHVDGHDLKRNILKRIWRPLPKVRDNTCTKLEDYIKGEEYIAISMREGDKTKEGFKFATTEQYVEKVEEVIPIHFMGKVPLIFVATDSCEPLYRLREARPEWKIVSECDRVEQHGYDLQEQTHWSQEYLDTHYEKFFVELFAMAGAKVWIGVTYTNVSWWVYFMRENTEEQTFYLLETEELSTAPLSW